MKKKRKMRENVKVGLLLRTEISTSFFFLFSVLLPSFCTTKHSRKLTLNSALIFSRRSHDFSAYTFFFRHSNIFFSYASAFWGCLRGTSFFFWIGLDLNATWPHVLWASSASWSAFLFTIMPRAVILVWTNSKIYQKEPSVDKIELAQIQVLFVLCTPLT